jgi:hypothetical protein
MRLNLTIDPDLDAAPPGTHISERRISRAESQWAKRMAQEFKAGKARKAEEQTTRKGFALNCGQTPRTFIAWRSVCAEEGRYKAFGAEVESKAMLGGVRGRNRQRLAAS